jgi:hypothetical protein
MARKTRKEIIEEIRDAGRRNAGIEFLYIFAKHPLDFAVAMDAFQDGLRAFNSISNDDAAVVCAAADFGRPSSESL